MLFKDSCNRKSNQQNLGTIKCSNLCTEIVEYTSPDETAVCNLASIALPRYVREKDAPSSSGRPKLTGSLNASNRCSGAPLRCCLSHFLKLASVVHLRLLYVPRRYFDFEKLREVASAATQNLNKIIDVNYYPAETARRSNLRHRPVGIGVQVRNYGAVTPCLKFTTRNFRAMSPLLCLMQGLADTFILLGMPFDSEAAKQLNKEIFETIYFAALETSCTLAKADGMTACHEPPFVNFPGKACLFVLA